MRNTYVLVAGKVRDLDRFVDRLKILQDWKRDGLIKGAVYSTWNGEIDQYPELRSKVNNVFDHVIETPEPKLKAVGHIFHQMQALHYGLSVCPDDCYILKTRLDLGSLNDSVMDAIGGALDLDYEPPTGWPKIFKKKLVTYLGFLLAPFYINDIEYYGHIEDVRKLVHFDASFEFLFSEMQAEQIFHFKPFVEHFPIFTTYFMVQKGFYYHDAEKSRQLRAVLLSSDFYFQVLASYLIILRTYFTTFSSSGHSDSTQLDGVSVNDVFLDPEVVPGLRMSPVALSPGIADLNLVCRGLFGGGYKRDTTYERFSAAIAQVSDYNFHRRWNCSPATMNPDVRAHDLAIRAAKLDGYHPKLLNPSNDGKEMRLAFQQFRYTIIEHTSVVKQLEAEVNGLRRQVEKLLAVK